MEHQESVAADDWVDQDLLTREEAVGRLEEEIAAVSGELAALHEGTAAGPHERAAIDLLNRRLDAMKAASTALRE